MSYIKDAFFGGAAKKAGKQKMRGFQAGADAISDQYAQTRGDFQQYLGAGQQANERLSQFLGLDGTDAQQGAYDNFLESPGQAFLRERQERSLLRNSAAIGGLGGGNVRTALQEQASGIASTQLEALLDRLTQMSGQGANLTSNLGALGGQSSANIANMLSGKGAAQAEGTLGRASGIRGGLGRVAGMFTGTGGITGQIAGALASQG